MDMMFLKEALLEAAKANKLGEVPVGAIIVKDGEIIARAHNCKEIFNDCTAHAEVLAIKEASQRLENWRLNGCEMYVTLEPCPMCASVIGAARLKTIYIGTFDPVMGACGSVINLLQNDYLNYNVDIKWIYSEACSSMITDFFRKIR
jgi:tRNA(adenine34) deaminase